MISKNGKNVFSYVTNILLILIALTDVALFSYVTVARHGMDISKEFFRDRKAIASSVPPSGYAAPSERVSTHSAMQQGWVVRYSSPRCVHCRADEARWSVLKSELIKKGYRIYEVPPDLLDAYAKDAPEIVGETQITFVDVAWMKQYRLRGTPTTLLFNSHGKAIWTQVGEMSQTAQQAALKIIRKQ